MNEIKVCYTCDDNYAKYTCVSIASILKNASNDDNLTIYIISNNISEENKNKLENLKTIKDFRLKIITPTNDLFKDFQGIRTTDYLPIASFFRLKISSLITDIDKVIYIDPDTIVNKSLTELYNIDISNYYCGGILDIGYKRLGKKIGLKNNEFYINSGVLLINLEKWRREKAEEKFINYASENLDKITLGDQDLINKCFAGNILKLDGKWNVQVVNFCSRSDYTQNFNILHYTGGAKPWKFGSYIPLKKYYFKYLDLTTYDKPNKIWHIKSTIVGFFLYLKHRPLFILRPGFYKSIFSYILKK